MDENTRKKILEIIRNTINEVVYDEMKQVPKKLQAKQEEMKKTKAQREQDAHDALFGKKDEEMTNKLRLHESEEKPKITMNELGEFEKEFKSHLPNIVFDKQIGLGKSGQIVDFPVKNNQKDAITSGKIINDKNAIGFSMSLSNGLKIKSIVKNGKLIEFEIDKETKDLFGKLLNLYEEIFKKRFNDIINPAKETEDSTGMETPPAAPVGAGNPPAAGAEIPGATTPPAAAPTV